MDTIVVPSKTYAQVYLQAHDGSTSYRYAMDMMFEGDIFHCKLSTHARVIDAANTVKKAFVYLVLHADHVQSLEVCDNDTEAIPSAVMSAFVKHASCTSSNSILGLRFVLKGHAPLVVPDLVLQKRPSSCKDIEAMLRMGQRRTFTVYLPSSAVSRQLLSKLCEALTRGALKPAPEGVISSLYTTTRSKIVTHVDELWGSNVSELPPPYDPSMAVRASDDESTGKSDFELSSSSRVHKKRRISSSGARQPLAEKSVPEPWEVVIAAIRAKFCALREEQQVRCTAVVDPENKPRFPPDQVAHCASPTDYVSHSQTITVGDTVEDRSMVAEEAIVKEQKQRALSNANADYNEQMRYPYVYSPPPWSATESNTPTEINTPTRVHCSIEISTPSTSDVSLQDQTLSTRCQSSPLIRPTVFTRGARLESGDIPMVKHVREMMEMLPNSLVHEILDAPGVHSLLAAQQQAEQTEIQSTQSGSRKVTATEVEQIVRESVDKHVDERLEQKIKVAFKSLVRGRVDRLVQDRLPLAADLVLHGATEGYRDQFYEDCKTNEASLLEMVDEGRTQVQDTMNDCIAEINDTIQNQIGELESWSGELSTSIGEQLARLGYWSDKFARSSASDRYAKKSMSRCKSI